MTIAASRIAWVDVAKAQGLALVFYLHAVEGLAVAGLRSAEGHYRFVSCFLLCFFFLLSGALVRPRDETPGAFLLRHLRARIVPVVAFNAVAALGFLGQDLLNGDLRGPLYLRGLMALVLGHPLLNFVTWFLVCLFTVELLHFVVGRFLRGPLSRGLAALAFFVVGGLVTRHLDAVVGATGVPANFWYVHEALVAYGFYLAGVLLGDRLRAPPAAPVVLAIAILGFGIAGLAGALNRGPFPEGYSAVVMAASSHGNLLWFGVGGLAGSLALLALARLTPPRASLLFVGRNTIAYLGFAGLFLQFVNIPLANRIAPRLADSHVAVAGFGAALTLASMLVSAPAIAILERWLPEAIGKRRRRL